MEIRKPHGVSPLFANDDQSQHGKRDCKIDKGKGNPGVLEANFSAQLDRVESNGEAKQLASKVKQRAYFGGLLSVAL